jgi:hypothetical protein
MFYTSIEMAREQHRTRQTEMVRARRASHVATVRRMERRAARMTRRATRIARRAEQVAARARLGLARAV